jgi:hypothetical protein
MRVREQVNFLACGRAEQLAAVDDCGVQVVRLELRKDGMVQRVKADRHAGTGECGDAFGAQ